MPDQFEARVREQMQDVVFAARKKIIQTENIMPLTKEPFTEMRT
jgi:hypothetical protein